MLAFPILNEPLHLFSTTTLTRSNIQHNDIKFQKQECD